MKKQPALIALGITAVCAIFLTGCTRTGLLNQTPDTSKESASQQTQNQATPIPTDNADKPLPSSTNINDMEKELQEISIEGEDFSDLEQ